VQSDSAKKIALSLRKSFVTVGRLRFPITSLIFALSLDHPEFRFLDLLVPWTFVIGVIGFAIAWGAAMFLERTGLSRKFWHFPLFFVALFILITVLLGFIFFP
jgi:hypothetical protein